MQEAGCPPFCQPDEWSRIVAASAPIAKTFHCQNGPPCSGPPDTAKEVAGQLSVQFPHLDFRGHGVFCVDGGSGPFAKQYHYWELWILVSPKSHTEAAPQPMVMQQEAGAPP